jgi:hypothetical protein
MRNCFGWVVEGATPVPAEVLPGSDGQPSIRISSLGPLAKNEPVDVAPSLYQGQAPDLSRPALPAPPERRRSAMGWVEERPPKGGPGSSTDWME